MTANVSQPVMKLTHLNTSMILKLVPSLFIMIMVFFFFRTNNLQCDEQLLYPLMNFV